MVDQPHHICAPCRVFGGSVEYSDFTSVHPDGIVLSAGSQPPQDDRHHTCRLSPACGGAVRLFQLHYCFLLMIIIDSLTAQSAAYFEFDRSSASHCGISFHHRQ